MSDDQKGKIFIGDFQKIAREELNNAIVSNLVMLGFFCSISGVVKPESIKDVISKHFKKQFEEGNIKAFDLGFEQGKKALEKRKS